MPMLLGTKEGDILAWRASRELVERLKQGLARKWGRSSARETESFLEGVIGALREEVAYESQLDAELGALLGEIAAAAAPELLLPLQARYREVAAAHFRRRGSVLALCGACAELHDALLERGAQIAEDRMLEGGEGPPPVYALLVSGDRARREQTLQSRNRYFLLHELDSPRFQVFSRELRRALAEAGLAADEELWHGSLSEWHALVQQPSPARGGGAGSPPLSPLPPFGTHALGTNPVPKLQWLPEALADLSFQTGYEPLGAEALSAASLALIQQKRREPFFQQARRVIHLPLALGHFGRWRLEREGEHEGEINLQEQALSPLVRGVRVLAIQAGAQQGGTLERVRELLYRGAMDVELSERLLKALQCLMQVRIESEIRSEAPGAFADPGAFGEEEETRVRGAVEAVLDLQKIAYQKLVGQG